MNGPLAPIEKAALERAVQADERDAMALLLVVLVLGMVLGALLALIFGPRIARFLGCL